MTIRIPTYSTRTERKLPAIAVAVAVDSYVTVPMHSFLNIGQFLSQVTLAFAPQF